MPWAAAARHAEVRTPMMPAEMRSAAAHRTAAVSAEMDRVSTAMPPEMHSSTAHGGSAPMSPAAMASTATAAVTTSGLGDRECRNRKGEKGGKREAGCAGHRGTPWFRASRTKRRAR